MKLLILENIRSAYNVGAIFRTADATGVDKIYLVGYTPTPIDRFGRIQPEIQKTSLGASETIEWEAREEVESLLSELKVQNVTILAIELNNNSTSLLDYKVPPAFAYVLGNEVEGVSNTVLTQADQVLHLPMLGQKESLNVSVTAGVVLYHDLLT
jgi:tRNA G18 (ribose-2'-O)-methylase SpoU